MCSYNPIPGILGETPTIPPCPVKDIKPDKDVKNSKKKKNASSGK